jgi:hypothetical protein
MIISAARPYFLLAFCFIFVIHESRSQVKGYTNKNDSAGHFHFQFLISTDVKAIYLNIVGGGVRYVKGEKSLSLIVFPSFRFGKTPSGISHKPFVTPGFATGILLQRKNFLAGIPLFYGLDGIWHITVGIGLRLE